MFLKLTNCLCRSGRCEHGHRILIYSVPALPAHYGRFEPGDAAFTRYVKEHTELLYIEKRRTRYGSEIVSYYAPADVIEEAWIHLCRRRQKQNEQAEKKGRDVLLGAAARRTVEAFLSLNEQAVSQVMRQYK